jgi:hypothetical protein
MTLGIIGLATITGLYWAWLWFIMAQPQKWAAIVDRENDFWVKRGLQSAQTAEKFKRWEKGRVLKVLLSVAAVLGTLVLTLALYYIRRL